MQKKLDISLAKLIFYISVVMSFIFVVVIQAFIFFYDYTAFKERLSLVEKQNIQNEESILRAGINEAYAAILARYKGSNDNFNHEIEESLIKARQQLLISVRYLGERNDVAEINKDVIKQILKLKNSSSYHVYDTTGDAVLNPLLHLPILSQEYLHRLSSGKISFLNLKDESNRQIRVAFIEIPELGVIIGYSADMSKFESEFFSSLKDFVREQSRDQSRYIFVLDTKRHKYIYSNFIDFDDNVTFDKYPKEAQEAFWKIKNLLSDSNSSGGILTYNWVKEDGKIAEKIAYVKDLGMFGLVIGKGTYLDGIDAAISTEQNLIKKQFVFRSITSAIYFIAVLFLAIFFSIYIKKRLDKTFDFLKNSFKKASQTNTLIPSDELDFKELQRLADDINVILKERQKEEEDKKVNTFLLEQYKNAIDESAIVTKTDTNGMITFVNDEFCELSGYSRDELIGHSHAIIRHPDTPDDFFSQMWQTIMQKRVWQGTIKNLDKHGRSFYAKAFIIPILGLDGEIEEFIAIRHDITDLIEQERRIQSHLQDPLTGLPNRQSLIDDISKSETRCTMASFDVRRFKEINEYYGFDMGDAVIVEIGRVIERMFIDTGLVLYKLNSDQFAILAHDKEYTPNKLCEFCQKIIEHFRAHPLIINENKFDVDLVFGISSEPSYFITSEMAKDYAKLSRASTIIFDDNKDLLIGNVRLTHSLKKAIEDDRIVVYRQAIIDNKTKKPAKYECLMRMIDEDGKVVSPYHFLNLAKRSGQYHKLTEIVIEKAFKFFSKNDDEFSVNLAIDDIVSGKIREFLRNKFKEYDGIASRLTLEIVEDEGIQNFKDVIEFIDEMHSYGCSIAVDDFGTGYSNFEYLMRLKADFVKIDGSMIKNIDQSEDSRRVVGLMVNFAKQLNIKTIAEFVHSEQVSDIAAKMGIDELQGYYYDEPKPLE